jgi:hypothetical protein
VGRHLCKLNGAGVMRKAGGRGSKVDEGADRIGLVIVCLGLGLVGPRIRGEV